MSFRINIVNEGLACSSLVIGYFNYTDPRKGFKELSPDYENSDRLGGVGCSDYYDCGCNDCEPKRNLRLKDFAFITASTLITQESSNEWLEIMGFTRTGPSYNKKNKTSVYFWVVPVETYVERYNEIFKKTEKEA